MSEARTPDELEQQKTLQLRQYKGEATATPAPEMSDTDLPAVPRIDTGDDEASPPSEMLGRYEILGSLGVGGMADVMLVRDEKLGRELAAKILHSGQEGDPEWMDKFLLEAQITGQLEHPNIVPVHDLGLTKEGRVYFTMKRVQGENLDQVLVRVKTGASQTPADPLRKGLPADVEAPRDWTLPRLLEVLMKCCDAIAFAHSRGVIHRDLKPANIMVGRFGEVQLMDWGLAKMVGSGASSRSWVKLTTPAAAAELTGDELELLREPHQTQVGVIVGTPAYMPPEQASGYQLDELADIYSLGAILYEILTLCAPYDARDPYDLLDKLIDGPPPRPTVRAPDKQIPWELEAVVLKAMARQPADRYRRVNDLKADIQAYLAGRTLQAAHYALWQRLFKWLARHRTASIAVAAVLMISLGLYWGIKKQTRNQLARVAARNERQLLQEIRRLHRTSAAQLSRVTHLSGPGARRMIQSNGELARDVVSEWYRAHSETLETLDRIARLADREPSSAVLSAIRLSEVNAERQRLSRAAAIRAAELGDETLALLWVRRAVSAGLDPASQKDLRDQITRARSLRISGIRLEARRVLLKARALVRAGGNWYEWSMAELLRSRGPELVRLLLAPEHLDSRYEWERRLTIEALGRLGDTRTRGPQNQDPVEALSARLAGVSLKWELELGVLIAQALGFLQDPRSHRILAKRRNQAGPSSAFWRRTAAAFARIPLPSSYFGSGPEAPRNAAGYLARGQLHAAKKNYRLAVVDFTHALEREPSVLALQLRGLAHIQLGQFAKALDDFEKANLISPRNPALLVYRGEARRHLHDLDGAIADYTRAIAENPRLASAYFQRGIAWRLKGQLDKAVEDYERAMSEDPQLAVDVHNSLGTIKSDRGDHRGAMKDFNRCLQLDAQYYLAYANRGAARHALKDHAGAIEDYTRALRINPAHAEAYLRRGITHLALKDHPAALSDYDRALELVPSLEAAYIHRGRARLMLKDLAGALSDLRRAVRKHPRSWLAWFNYAAALRAKGQYKQARDALHKARRWAAKPHHPKIEQALRQLPD